MRTNLVCDTQSVLGGESIFADGDSGEAWIILRLPRSKRHWELLRDAYDDYYAPIDRGIFEYLGPAMRKRGHAIIDDLTRIAFWKFGSWRHYDRISSPWNRRMVKGTTSKVFRMDKAAAADQVRKLAWEDSSLDGFGIPMASALLTVFNPVDYAVIDRYAWETYERLSGTEPTKKRDFTPKDYGDFVEFCRAQRRRLSGWTARDVEKALFASTEKGEENR